MKSESTHDRILDEIREKFALRHKRFSRKSHGGHPESLKKLAVSAVMSGIRYKLVADAAGVSEPSVRNWRKELEANLVPRELKLTEDVKTEARGPMVGLEAMATIHFQSGLRIEIPLVALTARFINELRGVSP
jgi:hypothetical protein